MGSVMRPTLDVFRTSVTRLIVPIVDSLKVRVGTQNRLMLRFGMWECNHFGVQLESSSGYLVLKKDRREMRLAHRHFIYASSFAENFDVLFSPLVPFEADGKLVVDYSKPGLLQTYAKSGLKFELAAFPEEEEAISGYFEGYTPRIGDTVFDLGAHCGVSTYHFSKLVGPAGRVIAFEPDPTNFALLLRNIERHGLLNVTPVQVAIAGSRTKVQFSCAGTIGSGISRYVERGVVGPKMFIDSITLTDAFEKWGTPQLCKIDIEGAELEVIGSSAALLERTNCHFVLDTSHKVGRTQTCERIEEMFRKSGYEVASSTTGIKTTWAAKDQDDY